MLSISHVGFAKFTTMIATRPLNSRHSHGRPGETFLRGAAPYMQIGQWAVVTCSRELTSFWPEMPHPAELKCQTYVRTCWIFSRMEQSSWQVGEIGERRRRKLMVRLSRRSRASGSMSSRRCLVHHVVERTSMLPNCLGSVSITCTAAVVFTLLTHEQCRVYWSRSIGLAHRRGRLCSAWRHQGIVGRPPRLRPLPCAQSL